jgi:hypothetical protein
LRKFAQVLQLFIFLPVAFLAWFAPSSAQASSPISNGGFDGSNGWTILQNGGSGMAFNSALQFSYATGEVSQSFEVSAGETVEVSFTVDNSTTNSVGQGAIADIWNASLTAGATVESAGRSTAHNQETFTLSLTVPSGTSSATLNFSGMDNGFWSGVYGPVIDSVSANITAAPFVATGYPADQQWEAVTYGDGKFVAVASSGSGNRVMTSTNGNYWTSRTSASDSNWQGITYAGNQFVAVGSNAVMTSPDGITWTSRTAPNGEWQAITNCGGLYVATATWGSNYIMSSTDGIEWTVRTPSTAWSHDAVACSAEVPRFVSVSMFGRGWSSANGTTGWSTQNPGAIVDIRTIAFGAGRFSWLEYSTNSGNRYGAYSMNGVNWTNTASAPANQWKYITYGGNKFIAVAEGGVNSRSAYSTDGANWTLGSGVPSNSWQGVAYGAGKYVAVANSGTGNRVMTSADGQSWESLSVSYFNAVSNLTATANNDGSVTLNWDAPEASNTEIYGYSVNFVDYDDGVERGGWGVWTTAANTSYLLSDSMFNGSAPVTTGYGPVRFKVYAMNGQCAGVGSGSCMYGPSTSADAVVLAPAPSTTTSTTSTSVVSTTTTSTIVISPPNNTTTTEPAVVPPPIETIPTDNTTVSIPDLDPTPVSTPELETTVTTVSPTTTTLIEKIFDPVEVTPVETPAIAPDTEVDEPTTSVPQYAPEQEATTDETPIVVPADTQDAADAAVEDIFDGPMSEAKLADAVDDLVADAETPEELTAVVTALLDQELTDTQFSTVIASVFSEPLTDENFAAAVDAVFEDPTKLSDEQFEDAVVAVFDAPLSDAQFEDAVSAVFEDTESLSDEQFDTAVQAVFEEPLTTEQFTAALEAVFDEPITDEKFDAIIDAVLDEPLSDEQFEELVGVLESETVTEEQVAAAVDSVIENGVTEEQATDLATSEKVLQSIDGDQATEIFDAVDIGAVTPEEAIQLVDAVQNAPTEVRESMEEEINVFQGAIDIYTPLDSKVPVSGRRVIVAATGIIVVAPRRRIR